MSASSDDRPWICSSTNAGSRCILRLHHRDEHRDASGKKWREGPSGIPGVRLIETTHPPIPLTGSLYDFFRPLLGAPQDGRPTDTEGEAEQLASDVDRWLSDLYDYEEERRIWR